MTVPQPPTSADGRLSRTLRDHGSWGVAAASAFAYAYARLAMGLFCRALGISPQDLGLGFEEHVTMTAFWLGAFTLWGAGLWLQQTFNHSFSRDDEHRWWKESIAGVLGVALLSTALIAGAAISPASPLRILWVLAGHALLVAGILAAAWLMKRAVQVPVAMLAALPLAFGVAGLYFSWDAGRSLTGSDADAGRIPLPIALVLGSSSGFVDGVDGCTMRLASNVFVSEEGETTVFATAQTFLADACDR